MIRTRYMNSHGLINVNNRSTAYDIALLSEYAMRNATFRSIVGCPSYEGTIKCI
jgi:D-alanyl-D-alanine carboxypeptidase